MQDLIDYLTKSHIAESQKKTKHAGRMPLSSDSTSHCGNSTGLLAKRRYSGVGCGYLWTHEP